MIEKAGPLKNLSVIKFPMHRYRTPSPGSDELDSEDDIPLDRLPGLLWRRHFDSSVVEPETPHAQQIDMLLPSSGPIRSSPVIEKDPVARKAHLRAKSLKRQRKKREEKAIDEKKTRQYKLQMILNKLNEEGFQFWDLMEYIFNPENKKGGTRWQQFFASQSHVNQMLDWWTSSKNSPTARTYVLEWIERYVAYIVSREARTVTKSHLLQTAGKKIDSDFPSTFSFSKINQALSEDLAPVSMSIIRAMATSRHVEKHSQRRKERTDMVLVFFFPFPG
jgi:hypothetical protein